MFRFFLSVWSWGFFSLHHTPASESEVLAQRSSRESSSKREGNASTVLLGLRITSPPLAQSILLTATRRTWIPAISPALGVLRRQKGLGLILEDFLEEEGVADQQHPGRCCPSYSEAPKQLFKGHGVCGGAGRGLKLQGAWLTWGLLVLGWQRGLNSCWQQIYLVRLLSPF